MNEAFSRPAPPRETRSWLRSMLATVGRNLATAGVAHVAARLLHLALLAAIGRALGVEELGAFAIAAAIGTCFFLVADLGIAPRLVREASARPDDAHDEYARALGTKLAIALPLAAAAAFLLRALPLPRSTLDLGLLMAVAGIVESFSILNHALCRARERFELEAAGEMLQALVLVVVGGACLLAGWSLVSIGYAAIAASGAELALSTRFARRIARLAAAPPRLQTISRALPYAAATFGVVALAQLDVLVLTLVASAAEVGRYAAVSRLLLGGAYLPMLAGDVVLPTATAFFANDAGVAWRKRRIEEAIGLGALAAALAGLAVVASAGLLIDLVYGVGLAPLAGSLRLGGVYVALKILTVAVQTILTVVGRQSGRAASVSAAVAVTAALILVLGSRYGAHGAVVALAAGEGAELIVAFAWLRDLYSPAAALRAVLLSASGNVVAVWMSTQAAGSAAVAVLAGAAVTSAASLGQRVALSRTLRRIRHLRQAPSAADQQ